MPALLEPDPSGSDTPLHAMQFLRFAIGGQHCVVRIDAVREILEVTHLTPLPLVPAFVSGVMNLRGSVVPVFDLSARLNLSATTLGRRSCIVVVDIDAPDDETSGGQTLGLLVDAVYEVFDCGPTELEPVPRLGTRIAACHLRQMVRSRGQATPEIDLSAILDLKELAELISSPEPCH